MSRYFTPYGNAEMDAHVAAHGKEPFAFTPINGNGGRMKCISCLMTIAITDDIVKTRNSVQSGWAIEHFLIVEWP